MIAENRAKVQKIRRVQDKVRRMLLDEWDPIGVNDVVQAQDEYDSYVGRVVSLIASGQGSFPIVQFLMDVETNQMGLGKRASSVDLEPLGQRQAALIEEL